MLKLSDNLDAEYGETLHSCHHHCHFHPLTPNDDNLLTIYRLFYLEKKYWRDVPARY